MLPYQPVRALMLVVMLTLLSCASVPKSFKESALDDMYPILTSEQYDKLKSLDTDEEISLFLSRFWQGNNEFKTEYGQRLEYANTHFPDRRGWGRSDRKRIYLIYGPPKCIDRIEHIAVKLGTFAKIKSMEIWSYMVPGKEDSFASYGDDIDKGERRFIFGDEVGSGFYKLMYSSEDCSDIDPRLFSH
jgi:GWxTD domain-containing protein